MFAGCVFNKVALAYCGLDVGVCDRRFLGGYWVGEALFDVRRGVRCCNRVWIKT